MNQDEDFSFSEMRRKRQGVQGGPAPHPFADGPGGYQGPNPAQPGGQHSPRMHTPHRPVSPVGSASQGFGIQDFYFLFFRHKWKIVGLFLASLVVAAGFYFTRSASYESVAKIRIRYILESSTLPPSAGGSTAANPVARSLDERGENIINSEIQILLSADLAKKVAEKVGPDKILDKAGGAKGDENDILRAAGVIGSGLKVEAPMRGNVLLLVFRHPDPSVVQPVLNAVVETYLRRSEEVYQGVGVMNDFFMRQADQLRTRLTQTEVELKKIKADAEIISLDDSKQAYVQVMTRIQNELLTAAAELAERRAALDTLRQGVPTNRPIETNAVAASVPPEAFQQFRKNAMDLQLFRNQLSELRSRYTDQHFMVRNMSNQIATAEAERARLEQEHPSLTQVSVPSLVGTNQMADLQAEAVRANILQARIDTLKSQLEQVRASAGRIADVEPTIAQLERTREMDEANYRFYQAKLEQLQRGDLLGANNTSYDYFQTPTPPARGNKKAMKPMLMIVMFGCLAGFAWGFVSDRILNPTIKQVVDLERQLPVPLFISVPDMARSGMGKAPKPRPKRSPGSGNVVPVGAEADGDSSPAREETDQAVGPWDPAHVMRPYYEGLRDRLITYFEVRNMNYKPKMVAITSCNHGSGVTTMAAGLAAALSETGDGKVLLVDMNLERGAAHPFFQGKPSGALTDALEKATREPSMVNDNLYLVSAHEPGNEPKNQQLPSVLPKRFTHLVPKMKASDYDYIIFDMPPVTQTSFTARMAGFMDMVLLVVESEKTGQGILKRTHELLNESRPNMAAILNKHRAYVPPKLAQEL